MLTSINVKFPSSFICLANSRYKWMFSLANSTCHPSSRSCSFFCYDFRQTFGHFVFAKSVTFPAMAIACTIDVILLDIANVFHLILVNACGYEYINIFAALLTLTNQVESAFPSAHALSATLANPYNSVSQLTQSFLFIQGTNTKILVNFCIVKNSVL